MCNSAIEFAEDKSPERQITMNAESIIMLIVSAGLMVYLLYALLRPEKF
jgi:K+-transporting ATPase KdpF subunit